jgi:ubiquinone/menaquinone biosynthesis C-methylase UbiE
MHDPQPSATTIDQSPHPVFARCFDRMSRSMEREVGTHRGRLLAGLSGRIIEVGAGNGMNFGHYPPAVEQVVAVEPEPYLREKARQAAALAPVPVRVVAGVASHLPFESGTVPDPGVALTELRRVLKDGGELRFMEHVRAERPAKARLQIMLDRSRIWPLFGGGCHCSRATLAALAAAGFRVLDVETISFGPAWWVTNPHVRGAARSQGRLRSGS